MNGKAMTESMRSSVQLITKKRFNQGRKEAEVIHACRMKTFQQAERTEDTASENSEEKMKTSGSGRATQSWRRMVVDELPKAEDEYSGWATQSRRRGVVDELPKAEDDWIEAIQERKFHKEKIKDRGDAGALHPSKRGKGRQNAAKKPTRFLRKTDEHWKIKIPYYPKKNELV